MLTDVTQRVLAGQNLAMEEMASVVDLIMQGRASDEQVGTLLLALRAKGETVEEIAGAARAMRLNMTPVRTRRSDLVDTCGTGGDSSGTFNISTAAAIVAAGAGVAVAKHGNRSITSKSGSADCLAALGVNIDAEVGTIERCLDELGICFCFAPRMHPSMKHVAAVRKKLGVPTIFNLLGPLCNPAHAPYQLLGVGKAELRPRLAAALKLLETQRAAVLTGGDGLDEVTLAGPTHVSLVEPSGTRELIFSPSDFGIEPTAREGLQVDGPEQSAALIREILQGAPGAPRQITILNAAAAIWMVDPQSSLKDCAARAAESLDSGAADRLLAGWIEVSRS